MPFAQPCRNPHVRPSTDADMALIYAWLLEQDRNDIHGTFFCNWRLTAKCHEERRLLVYIDPKTQEPVAYQWGSLVRPGILEVRNDWRGRGIGRELVEHCLALTVDANEPILTIECKPSTSIPFWRRMGFQLLSSEEHGKNYAVRLVPRQLELPEGGEPVEVVIEWFSERRKREPLTPPVMSQTVRAVVFEDEVYLAERIMCCEDLVERDVVVRVTVNGQEWYCDKAKYKTAEYMGLVRCTNGFYADMLYHPQERP